MAQAPNRTPAPGYPQARWATAALPAANVPATREAVGFGDWAIWRSAFVIICLVAAFGTAAIYLLSLTSYLSVEGDNAVYIILAKALATGHGYTDIQGPVPRVEAQYPFLFPLLLTPIVFAFGTGAVMLMQFLVTLFALGSFAVGFFLFRRWLNSAPLALVIVLATASSDLVWSFSHKVLTEIPYSFFTLLACLMTTRYAAQEDWRTRAGFYAALAASVAFLTRTIGLGLCVAVPLFLLIASPLPASRDGWWLRLKKAAFSSAILLVTVGGWTLRNRVVFRGQGHNYIGQFSLKNAYVPEAGRADIHALLVRMGDNLGYYAQVYQRMLVGHVWDGITLGGHLSPLVLMLTLAGFLYALVWRRTVAEPYIFAYVVIVLLWPWQDLRFAVPVLPFLFYYLAQAVLLPFLVLDRLPLLNPRLLVAIVLLPFAVRSGLHTVRTALDDRQVGYHYEAGRLGEWPAYPDWVEFHKAALWLQRYALPGSTVINRSPNLLYLWTGLPSRNYPYTFNRAAVLRDISREHNDYVIYDSFDWTYTTKQYLRPVIVHYRSHFVALKQFGHTTVYQVLAL